MTTFQTPTVDQRIQATLTDGAGAVVDLTSATVRFLMRAKNATSAKVAAAATIVNAAGGVVKYTWTGTDTDTAGRYLAEFEVTIGGKKQSFPNDRYIDVVVLKDLD